MTNMSTTWFVPGADLTDDDIVEGLHGTMWRSFPQYERWAIPVTVTQVVRHRTGRLRKIEVRREDTGDVDWVSPRWAGGFAPVGERLNDTCVRVRLGAWPPAGEWCDRCNVRVRHPEWHVGHDDFANDLG
jgi:hypothetical protein